MINKFDIIEFDFDDNLLKHFIQLEKELYKNNNYQLTFLQLQKTYPVFEYVKIKNYIVIDNKSKPILRASAIINPYLSLDNKVIGLIGFFESTKNYKPFQKLISKIIEYFKTNKISKIIAPVNFNTFHKYRFVTQGFENYFILDIQNKEYYPTLFEKFGFKIIKNYYSTITYNLKQNLEFSKYNAAINNNFEFRKLNKNEFLKELEIIYNLSVNNFEDSFLFNKISFKEFLEIYKPSGNYLDKIEVYFACKNSKEIGFLFYIYDKDYVVFKSITISNEYRNQGIGSALFYLAFKEALEKNINTGIFAFMREDNKVILKLTNNSTFFKKYSLFLYEI